MIGRALTFSIVVVLTAVGSASIATSKSDTILYSFQGGSDGFNPRGGLVADASGNLYGTTVDGGADNWGTVFRISPDGTETVLHSFDLSDGASPSTDLVLDSAGNLYGTTYQGGHSCCGTAFRLSPDGTLTTLHSFCNRDCSDGANPGDVIVDKRGNLYGSTSSGGDPNCDCGVVYKLKTDGKLKVLHTFVGGSTDGAFPSRLILDKSGNLYGVTGDQGPDDSGTVFEIAPDGTETITALTAVAYPSNGLVMDKAGNLYGTASIFEGRIFKLAPDGTQSVLYSFTGQGDGSDPGLLWRDRNGNIFGTTQAGGDLSCNNGFGCGIAYKLTADGTFTVLHTFKGGKDGAIPTARLIPIGRRLYSTTTEGGSSDYGTVFQLKK